MTNDDLQNLDVEENVDSNESALELDVAIESPTACQRHITVTSAQRRNSGAMENGRGGSWVATTCSNALTAIMSSIFWRFLPLRSCIAWSRSAAAGM